ncbi:M28 family peptidase [Alkaliflexus imshenetskii]|uniref:M28 family peptidase n=1 Tax=Alkaliflexus imshenetskii TaxID=286730 RepID=UPI00047ECD80|nr:M28 family peptidase [Alkaliflexus imshenetskii]
MNNKLISLGVIAMVFGIISCGQSTGRQTTANHQTKPDLTTPVFDADSAYHYIDTQVAFGPRVPNTPEHLACAEYLAEKLEQFGAEVIVQQGEVRAFDNTILNIRNIIGQFQPEKNDRILLFAHWDTRPFADHDPDPALRNKPILGANDGASGVGVLLEIARHLKENPTHPGIDIIFFDAEDYGIPDHIQVAYKPDTWCLGSQFWGRNPHRKNYYARFGILLDMVGAKGAQFYREQYSMQFAPRLVDHIWNTAARLGFSAWFNFGTGGMITDDHVYVYKHLRIPSVNIIQYEPASHTSFGHYWHTHQDTMDNIDRNTLKAVGQTVMEVIYTEK